MKAEKYAEKSKLGEIQIEKEDLEAVRKIAELAACAGAGDEDFYSYRVPRLTAEGTCSVLDELDPEPYDLAKVLGGRTEANSKFLIFLNALLREFNKDFGAGWIGVYKKFGCRLVKLAYVGVPSRAEYPLTEEFAKTSNNSKVGLTGKAVVINDVEAHLRKGGAYYKCDEKVNSEACLPVFSRGMTGVAGIIDAEDSRKNFFSKEKVAKLAAICIELGEMEFGR